MHANERPFWVEPATPSLLSIHEHTGPDGESGLDVLVIDGHRAVRHALEATLGHLGHLVFSVPTLANGLQLMRGLAIDLIICDFHLPDGDAPDLISHWPGGVRRVPTVVIGDRPDPILHGRCLAAGFDAFLAKPIAIESLRRAIRNVARRED